MLQTIHADLHIHTCLSPCGDLTSSPRAIVKAAAQQGLGMIAISDHNSAENVPAALRAAAGTTLTVLPGMEVTTAEEVHILTLFPDAPAVFRMQNRVYECLQPGENDEKFFGEQVVVNERDEVEGFNNRLLIGATSMPVEEVVRTTHDLGGLAIASHVDRETFGLIGQLGMIPENLPLDAVEISRHMDIETARTVLFGIEGFPIIRSSDAHSVDDIGTVTTRLRVEAPTFDELRMAIRQENGRTLEDS